jgi:uncharacterized protein (TIGR02594 family)
MNKVQINSSLKKLNEEIKKLTEGFERLSKLSPVSTSNEAIRREKLLTTICKYVGLQEFPGKKHQPKILAWLKDLGFGWIEDDETPWCSTAHNAIMKEAGREYTKKLNARSWLSIGVEISKDKAIPFDSTVVLWRLKKDSVYGHVGFYVNHDENHIWLAGGNQANKYGINKYPIDRVLSIRNI